MTFAVPLFLLAALAGAIPVALHMINRQKVKDLPFPTLQFLRISVEKTRRRKRIEDVILMLIRVAALLLIAFGLARPTITSLGALFSGGANSAVAVIIDNSASMGTIDKDRIRFETATVAAEQILGELEDGDQVVAMLTSGPPRPEQEQLERDQAKAVQLLNQAQLSYERADLGVHLGQARQLLASSTAPNKYIYVLSDMQSSCWESLRQAKEAEIEGKRAAAAKGESKAESGESPAKDASPAPNGLTPEQLKEAQSIPVIVVDVNRVPKPNVAVQRLTLQTTVPVAGVPIKATVELLNTAKVDQQRRAELWVDGTRESVSPELNIPAEGTMVHEFVFSFQRGGMHKGEVRLVGDDGNKLDDRRFFSMDVDQAVPVAVVKAARHEIPYLEDTFYLEHALNPDEADNWAMQTTSLVAGDLMSENLEAYKVIFCVNLPTPNADVAARLQEYVMGGGTLVWIAGDNVEPEQYNRMNEESQNALLPAPLLDARAPVPGEGRDSWRVTFLDKEHPALRTLVEPASLYESILVYKQLRFDTSAAGEARVLARVDDGEPLLLERAVEQGKVLFLGTGAHVQWTNLPLRNIFVPLVAQLTLYSANISQNRHDAIAGVPIVIEFEKETRPVAVEVLPPSGATIRLNTQQEEGTAGQVFRYADTHDVGIYVLRLLDAIRPTQLAYSVNLDPDESVPTAIAREEFTKLLEPTPVIFAEDPDDLSSTFKLLREGKSLWGLFLTAVLAVLVFEAFLANRLTPKQTEPQVKQLLPRSRPFQRQAVGAG